MSETIKILLWRYFEQPTLKKTWASFCLTEIYAKFLYYMVAARNTSRKNQTKMVAFVYLYSSVKYVFL